MMTVQFAAANSVWMQSVYGKRVASENGPILPRFEHRCTSRSPEMIPGVARLLCPYFVGIGTDDLSDWSRYPWTSSIAGGLIVQAHSVDAEWWLIAGRIRSRSEGGDGAIGHRQHIQAIYFVQRVCDSGDWILQDCPSKLVATPDTRDAPNDRGLLEIEHWAESKEELPEGWFEAVEDWIFKLLCGRTVAVVDRVLSPDEFYLRAMRCLACFPGCMRWRIPIGAGHFPINPDQVALGHGTGVRTTTNVDSTDASIEAQAQYYLKWLRNVIQGKTTISDVLNAVDSALPSFAKWNAFPPPEAPGLVPWRAEMAKLRALATELNLLDQVRDYIWKPDTTLPASLHFEHFKGLVIDEVVRGLQVKEKSSERACKVLAQVSTPEWVGAWKDARRRDNSPVLEGIVSILTHTTPSAFQLDSRQLSQFGIQVDLPEELYSLASDWLRDSLLSAFAESEDRRSPWRELVANSHRAWVVSWCKRDKVLARWLLFDAFLHNPEIPVPKWADSTCKQSVAAVKGISSGTGCISFEQLNPVLKDIRESRATSHHKLVDVISKAMLKKASPKLVPEYILLCDAIRQQEAPLPDSATQKSLALDQLANRFEAFRDAAPIRNQIFNRWSDLEERHKKRIKTSLGLPGPYIFILCGDSDSDAAGSQGGAKLLRSDQDYLKSAIMHEVTKNIMPGIAIRVLAKSSSDPELREWFMDLLSKTVLPSAKTNPRHPCVYMANVRLGKQVDVLPEIPIWISAKIDANLSQFKPDPRKSSLGLSKNVSSVEQFYAYLVAAGPMAEFPSCSTTPTLIIEILESIEKNRELIDSSLKRMGVGNQPMWRLLRIREPKVVFDNLTNDEATAIGTFMSNAVKSDFAWFCKYISNGNVMPPPSNKACEEILEQAISSNESVDDLVNLGIELKNHIKARNVDRYWEFAECVVHKDRKSAKDIDQLVGSLSFVARVEGAGIKAVVPALSAVAVSTLTIGGMLLWNNIGKWIKPLSKYISPMTSASVDNATRIAVLTTVGVFAITFLYRYLVFTNGPLDKTPLGKLVLGAHKLREDAKLVQADKMPTPRKGSGR